ncbi:MAG: helix-turn-helix transcriptional regulator [Planctomycetota bacterium]
MSAASRSARLRRALRLIRELCRHRQGVSIYDLARSEELSVKTIRRDILMLQEEGIPIEETLGDRGRRLLRISAPLTELTFEYDELLSLYLGRRLLEPFAGTPLFEGIHSLFQKLERRLFRESRSVLQELSDGFHQTRIGISDYSDRGQLITTVLEAVRTRVVLCLQYQKTAAAQPSAYLLHPYSLVHHHGALYLIAFSEAAAAMRHFKLDRVHSAELLERRFTPPADFDPQEYLDQGFGIFSPSGRSWNVRIHFAAAVAAVVRESHWHRSQEIELHPDGSLTLKLKLRNLEEVKSWVQSFGPLARVLEPEELVDALVRDLSATLQAYAQGSPPITPDSP